MMISIIAAVAENRVIGAGNRLIWHLPEDLKNFKRLTTGNYIIMGRKTWESIGKPLPGRTNIIVTRDRSFKAPGCIILHSIEKAIEYAGSESQGEVFIIGGGELYRQSLSFADKIYLTKIHASFNGDTYFPELKENEWKIIRKTHFQKDEKHPYEFDIIEMVKSDLT